LPRDIPAQIGRFRILGRVASGGMAEVYRARDPLRHQLVAVKLLPRRVRENSERERALEGEARALRSITDPRFCQLLETGRLRGRRYLVLEFVRGRTLAQRLRRGPVTIRQAVSTGAAVASALVFAHRRGFVHGDLKPANIMLTRRSIKLLDFGLAEVAARRSGAGPQGKMIGTCQYAAPELVRGKARGPASDIFGLGVILFEMLTARRPFEGLNEASVMLAVLHHHPPAPSSLRRSIPPAADRLVQACLSKNPQKRPSATQLAASLGRLSRKIAVMRKHRILSSAVTEPRKRRR
jgi:eukaryotic-like serine/threonine-protein kinase